MTSHTIRINGRPMDRNMIVAAEEFISSKGSIDNEEVAQLFCVAMDAGRLTKIERDTFEYIRTTYLITNKGQALLSFLIEQAKKAEGISQLSLRVIQSKLRPKPTIHLHRRTKGDHSLIAVTK